MILQALTAYYEQLLRQGKIAAPTLHINKRTIPFMRLPATFHWLNTNFRPVCGAPHNL